MRYVGNHSTLKLNGVTCSREWDKGLISFFLLVCCFCQSSKESPVVFQRKQDFLLPNQQVPLDNPLVGKWVNLPGPQKSHEYFMY